METYGTPPGIWTDSGSGQLTIPPHRYLHEIETSGRLVG